MKCKASRAGLIGLLLAVGAWGAPARAQKAPEPDPEPPRSEVGDEDAAPPAEVRHEFGVNLLAWGDFERPRPDDLKRPAGWAAPDGLTQFWVDDPDGASGTVMRLDSTPDKEQVYEYWEALKKDPAAPPPVKRLASGKYGSIGATYGATLYSEKVWIEPGAAYRLTADVKAEADFGFREGGEPAVVSPGKGPKVKIWVKGYLRHQGRDRVIYKARKDCEQGAEGDHRWYTYTRTITPTRVTKNVQWLRVMLMAYWPPGRAWVDNVRLEKIPLDQHRDTETDPPRLRDGGDRGAAEQPPKRKDAESSEQRGASPAEAAAEGMRGRGPVRNPDADRFLPSAFILLPSAFLAPLVPPAPDPPWWDARWSHRVLFEAEPRQLTPVPEGGYALEFPVGLELATEGRDLRVIDPAGQPRAFFTIWAAPGEHVELILPGPLTRGRYAVYYGNPSAEAAPAAEGEPAALVLEVRTRPAWTHSLSRDQWERMWARAGPVQQRGLRTQIWDGYNPFGPSDQYMSYYRGTLRIDREDDYLFCTASDDASYLLIDGKEVCAWPGAHDASEGLWGKKSGTVRLTAGRHRIEYLHEEGQGGQAVVAGWKPPGAKIVELIPAGAFVQPVRLARRAGEQQSGRPAPAFTYRRLSELDLGGPVRMAELEFYDRSADGRITRREWAFGDGVTATDERPRHVYLRQGEYQVRLSVWTGDADLPETVTRRLTTDVLFHQPHHDEQRVERYCAAVADYPFAALDRRTLEHAMTLLTFETEHAAPLAKVYDAYLVQADGLPPREQERHWERFAELCLTETGDYERARGLYARLAGSAAPRAQAVGRVGLARAAFAAGRLDEAADRARQALDQDRLAQPAAAREAALVQGDVARERGRAEEALAAYAEAQALAARADPRDFLARVAFAPRVENFLLREDFRAALEELDRWGDRFPEDRLAGYYSVLRARALLGRNKPEAAIRECLALAAARPGLNEAPECLYLAAVAETRRQRWAEAAALLARLEKEYPESPRGPDARRLRTLCERRRDEAGGG